MAKKQPDYAKAVKESGELLARMKLARGQAMGGSCYGSGDRAVAIEQLKALSVGGVSFRGANPTPKRR